MKGKNSKREERQRKLAAALMIGAMGAVTAEPAIAQELQRVSADERIEFDIASQPLSSALSEFARQARVNTLYFSDDLRGLSSTAVRGSFTREEALTRLLARSGYSGRINGGNLVLVQEQSSRPQRESAANGAETTQASSAAVRGNEGEEEIVVTGTRIRGAAPAGANVLTLDREEIDALGRSSVQDVIQTLPQNFAGSQNEATQEGTLNARSNFTFGSSVDLRGLGADATLTLVNGRRLAAAGNGNYVDIVLATDRRTYLIEAIAVQGSAYSAQTAWRYPSDRARGNAASIEGVALEELNFRYRIETVRGRAPHWRPVRVFDDGRRTYVEFPLDIATSEAPPLFLRDGPDVALVNYRVVGNRYVIDRLFDSAELRLGGQRQTIVRISRERPRARGGPR